jgi:putative metallohydrolase (TIGR04338 family)
MPKTSQAEICYDAEHEVEFILEMGGTTQFYGSTLTVPQEMKFGDIDSVERYLKMACHHIGYKGDPPSVRARRGTRKAHYEPTTQTIAVPPHVGSRDSWAMRETVVLHELAHHLTRGHGHDSTFCSALIFLYTSCIGHEAGLLLTASFDERGVHTVKYTI